MHSALSGHVSKKKLPGMAGETSDAISAYTRIKVTEAPRSLGMPKEECPEIRIRIPPRQRPRSCKTVDDPAVPLERFFFGDPVAGLPWERKFEELIFERLRKSTFLGNVFTCARSSDYSYRYLWTP